MLRMVLLYFMAFLHVFLQLFYDETHLVLNDHSVSGHTQEATSKKNTLLRVIPTMTCWVEVVR